MKKIEEESVYEAERTLLNGFALKGIDLKENPGIKLDVDVAVGYAIGGDPDMLISMLESMKRAFSKEPGIDRIIEGKIEKLRV